MGKQSNTLRRKLGLRVGSSVRSYRRVIDMALNGMYEGTIAPSEAKAIAVLCKTAAELLMGERLLSRGIGDTEDSHPHGADGGLELDKDRKGTFTERQITTKTGTDRFGEAIEDTKVVVKGSAKDADLDGSSF